MKTRKEIDTEITELQKKMRTLEAENPVLNKILFGDANGGEPGFKFPDFGWYIKFCLSDGSGHILRALDGSTRQDLIKLFEDFVLVLKGE